MSLNIKGTEIIFSDASSQNTAFNVPAPAVGTIYTGDTLTPSLYGSSWQLSSARFIILKSGSVKIRTGIANGTYTTCDSYGCSSTYYQYYVRVYINGVAVGIQYTGTNGAAVYSTQDFTVAAGDIIQLGSYTTSGVSTGTATLAVGVINASSLAAIAYGRV